MLAMSATTTARPRPAFVALLGALAFLPAATTDMHLPALPDVAHELSASEAAVQLTVSWVLLGAALGQLVIGPISDRVGRRIPVLVGLGLYVVVSLLCVAAESIGQLVALRTLHGVVGATASVGATAIIGDRWRGTEAARLLSRLWLGIALAPVLAPLVGAAVADAWGWRAVFAVLAAIAAVLAVVVARALPETLPPARRSEAGVGVAVRAYGALLRDRRFVAYALLPGLSLVVIMSYVASSPFVFQGEYGLSPRGFAVVFGLGATSMLVGAQLNAALVRRVGPGTLLALGVPAAVLTTAAMVVATATRAGGVVGLVVPLWLTMALLTGIIANSSALALERHPTRTGTAAAVLGIGQGALGGLVSPLAGALGGGGLAMTAVMCGAAVLSLAVVALGTPVVRDLRRAPRTSLAG